MNDFQIPSEENGYLQKTAIYAKFLLYNLGQYFGWERFKGVGDAQ